MRLFVAIDVPADVAAEMRRVRLNIQPILETAAVPPRLTWVREGRLHLTVRFIGDVPDEIARDVQAAIERPLDIAAFDVVWNTIGAFPNVTAPRAVWLGADVVPSALHQVAQHVNDRLQPIVGPGDGRPFAPHLTLARVRERGRGVAWPRVLATAAPRPVAMRVDRVTLYRSELSSDAPTYTAMGGVSLRLG